MDGPSRKDAVIDPVQHFLNDPRARLRREVSQRRFAAQRPLGLAQPAVRLRRIAEHVYGELVDPRQPRGFIDVFESLRLPPTASQVKFVHCHVIEVAGQAHV